MRGALGIRLLLRFLAGIIPAYAGSTHAGRRRGVRAGDHPRVCGEHHPAKEAASLGGGSSPRMRGAPVDLLERGVAPGIIPAYAGSTSPPRAARGSGRDHPRVCGEHVFSAAVPSSLAGSSPRMRGALVVRARHHLLEGIIPAYAGSTGLCRPGRAPWGDHPRVCGEHLKKPHWHVMLTGSSSPRMRGAPPAALTRLLNRRIIPAYAGSTGPRRPRMRAGGDHPRVCGEHGSNRFATVACAGSSPRMRGAPEPKNGRLPPTGIIPAYAGSTGRIQSPSVPGGDHPRVCGEHRKSALSMTEIASKMLV